jgi:hypothetical protein
MDMPAFNGFPPDSDARFESAEPYVHCEVENMKGWVKWKVRVKVKGDDIQEMIRLSTQAEDHFNQKYGAQDKEIKSSV